METEIALQARKEAIKVLRVRALKEKFEASTLLRMPTLSAQSNKGIIWSLQMEGIDCANLEGNNDAGMVEAYRAPPVLNLDQALQQISRALGTGTLPRLPDSLSSLKNKRGLQQEILLSWRLSANWSLRLISRCLAKLWNQHSLFKSLLVLSLPRFLLLHPMQCRHNQGQLYC
jgi:hypothetical protein